MDKYAALSPEWREKVNATIEIFYQRQMASGYPQGEAATPESSQVDHYEEDVVYDGQDWQQLSGE